MLKLITFPSTKEEHWIHQIQETDALLVGGGDPLYLCYWMRQFGAGLSSYWAAK